MDLDAATDELYGVAPEAFLPRRTGLAEQARSAGDRELAEQIGGLRKPSVGAWAVNHLVRARPGHAERLRDLASRLRAAQQSLDGAALKTLGRERAALVDALVHAAVDAAREQGVTVSAALARDVADTFVAALASSAATDAVVSGRLTRTVTYAGFGDVDLSDATARPLRAVPEPLDDPATRDTEPHDTEAGDTAPAGGPDAAGRDATEPDGPAAQAGSSDRRAARAGGATPKSTPGQEAAQAQLRAAMARATRAAAHRSSAAAQLERAEARVADLARQLAQARADRDARAEALASAEATDDDAQARVHAAREALDGPTTRSKGPSRRRG